MKELGIKGLIPTNIENEKWFISYLLREPDAIDELENKYFQDKLCSDIFKTISKLEETEYQIDLDTVYSFCKERVNRHIKKEEIQNIYNEFQSFDNINYVIQTIKDNFTKNNIGDNLDDIIQSTVSHVELDHNKISDFGEKLTDGIFTLQDDNYLKDTKTLVDNYRKILKEREEGFIQLSIGDPELDKKITRPGAPKEMTGIVGKKGTGKSLFAMGLENGLMNQGIPVVAFDIEMTEESLMDRRICMRENISVEKLMSQEKDDELREKIDRGLKRLEDNPYFLSYNEPGISLKQINKYLKKARKIFIQKGILEKKDHFVAKFDLVDMIEEFDDADPKKIKANINKMHRMARKHNAHFILVLQSNENELRKKPFERPEDCDFYHLKLADIEGGAAFAARCRVVVSINRPLELKKEYFSKQMEEWDVELDTLNIHGIKQNDGKLFFIPYVFGENFRIYPLKKKRERRRPTEDE
jgi:replicative DNA helicase